MNRRSGSIARPSGPSSGITKGLLTLLVVNILSGAMGSCGKPGKDSGGQEPTTPEPEPSPSPQSTSAPLTGVGFSLMTPAEPEPVGCAVPLSLEKLPSLTSIASHVWSEAQALWRDPAGDANLGADIRTVFGGVTNDALVIAFDGVSPTTDVTLAIELGGATAQKSSLQETILRQYFVSPTQVVERFHDGAVTTDQVLASDQASIREEQGRTEVIISKRLVADIMTWPVWWIRVSTRQTPERSISDFTSARYYPSAIGSESDRFTFTGCGDWGNHATPFKFTEVIDRDVAKAPETQFKAVGLVRRAFDGVTGGLGVADIGVDQLAILTTSSTSTTPTEESGVRSGARNDAVAAIHGRGIVVDVSQLERGAIGDNPEETLTASAARQLIGLYVNTGRTLPARWLIEAMAIALYGHWSDTNLGRVFFLDEVHQLVELLNDERRKTVDDPRLGSVGSELRDIDLLKSRVFGLLLWSRFPQKIIHAAWQQTLADFESTSGGFADNFKSKLIALSKSHDSTKHWEEIVQAMWSGWIEGDTYDPLWAFPMLMDPDNDGLPNFLEKTAGFHPERADTDNNGWSDLVDYAADGKIGSAGGPVKIAVDGLFDDWTRLLPQRIVKHLGQAGACPADARITHFASLADDKAIVLAAHSDRFDKSGSVVWEAQVSFPEIRRILTLSTSSDGHGVEVREGESTEVIREYRHPWSQITNVSEWSLTLADVGVDPIAAKLTQKNAVAVRYRTMFVQNGTKTYCDETSWFETNIVR